MIRACALTFLTCGIAVVALAGCGGGADDTEGDTAADSALAVCDLLADADVSQVLPGHDGGIVTADGGSLIEGVDTWQCSYTAQGGDPADFDLLTVVVTRASTPEQFEQVRPSAAAKRETYSQFSETEAGDGYVYGEANDTMVDIWQGTTLVTIELVADDAAQRATQLILLAGKALAAATR